MNIVAIDPGTEQSAYVLFDGETVIDHGIERNEALLARFGGFVGVVDMVVFEQIESFGMAVGREVFETVFWTGRMFEAAREVCAPQRMPRKVVKLHLCQSNKAKDANIRTALLDRFGGKDAAIGKTKTPGPLFGVKAHEWSALAIAVTWWDLNVILNIDRSERTAASV